MSKKRRAALYARAGTGDDEEAQLNALRAVAARAAWQIVETYTDRASGQRPALTRLLEDVKSRRFDIVAAQSADRLGSSLTDLVDVLRSLRAAACDLWLELPPLDTTTPHGKYVFKTADLFAELERVITQSRLRDGLVKARAQGKKFGRPPLDPKTAAEIRARAAKGKESKREIARDLGVSERVVWKILATTE